MVAREAIHAKAAVYPARRSSGWPQAEGGNISAMYSQVKGRRRSTENWGGRRRR
jgi:hypothetical protein